MHTSSRLKRAQSDSFFSYIPSDPFEVNQPQTTRIRAKPLNYVEYQLDDVDRMQSMVRECEDFIGIMADLGVEEPILHCTSFSVDTTRERISITGPRTQAHYLSAIRIILGLRKKVRNGEKMKNFWKDKAKEANGEDLITPSASDIESVHEPLDPQRQARVDDYFATKTKSRRSSFSSLCVNDDEPYFVFPQVSQFDFTLPSTPGDFGSMNRGDSSDSSLGHLESPIGDGARVATSNLFMDDLSGGIHQLHIRSSSLPSDMAIVTSSSLPSFDPTSSLLPYETSSDTGTTNDDAADPGIISRNFTSLSDISEGSEPCTEDEPSAIAIPSPPAEESKIAAPEPDAHLSGNWEADFSWEAESVTSTPSVPTPPVAIQASAKSRLPVLKRLIPSRLPISLSHLPGSTSKSQIIGEPADKCADALKVNAQNVTSPRSPTPSSSSSVYNLKTPSKTTRRLVNDTTALETTKPPPAPTPTKRISWDKTFRTSVVPKALRKRISATEKVVPVVAPLASRDNVAPTLPVAHGHRRGQRMTVTQGKENRG